MDLKMLGAKSTKRDVGQRWVERAYQLEAARPLTRFLDIFTYNFLTKLNNLIK